MTTTDATPAADAATEAPAFDPNTVLDEFGKQAYDRTVTVINEYNAKVGQVKAANGDPQALLENLRESYTDNEKVNKIRAAIEDLDNKRETLFAARDEILKPIVDAQVEAAKSGTEGIEAEAKEMKKKVDATVKYIAEIYGAEVAGTLPKIQGKRAGSTASTGSSGQRRIRGFDVWVDGKLATSKNGKNEDVSNLAAAAKQIGVSTEDARDAFWAAAGSDDPAKYPSVVEWTMSVDVKGEGDKVERKTFNLVAKKVVADAPRATETADAPAA